MELAFTDAISLGLDIPVRTVHQNDAVVEDVIGSDELPPDANRPRRWTNINRQIFLNFVNNFKDVTTFAVHLVTERHDRQVP